MKSVVIYTLLCAFLVISAQAKEVAPRYQSLLNELKASPAQLADCLAQSGKDHVAEKVLRSCLKEQLQIERITIYGRYVGIETPEAAGRFYLDKSFIDAAPKGNGDINELIALLPGVELSEQAFALNAQTEVKAPELSISGGTPWQTGFFIDGLNYNSHQDPAASGRTVEATNDVQGGVQTMNINSQLVSGVQVFDNNIPVEYGGFSGGVVDVETITAFEQAETTSLSLGYRGTQSRWANYRFIQQQEYNFGDRESYIDETPPDFKKNSYHLKVGQKIDEHHAFLFNINYLESLISGISLNQKKSQQRRTTNAMLKYSYRRGWLDRLDWSLLYAPYENHNYLKDTMNSDLVITGGALSSALNLSHDLGWAHFSSEMNISQSENSRKAPPHFYLWQQAKGKSWGQYADQISTAASDDSDEKSILLSKEGGHGSLEKTQLNLGWKTNFHLSQFEFGRSSHALYFGSDYHREELSRDRDQASYNYFSPFQYSTLSGQAPLNCSGYRIDCIELSFYQPLEELERELGEPLDFNNPAHIEAYSNNVRTTPQYFKQRLVRPEEHIDTELNQYALFVADQVEWGRYDLNLALRASYDDFFRNINISPRLSFGVDLLGDGDSKLILGLNRYYDAGLMTYKIREQQQPSRVQHRPIQNGYLQGWLNSNSVASSRYRFTHVKTPYDNELVLGWKQATQSFGSFSIKYVKRQKRDQLTRNSDPIKEPDGFIYKEINNNGFGESERYSFSWNAKYGRHSLWMHTSYSESTSNARNYDKTISHTDLEDILYLDGDYITKGELQRIKESLSRPVRVGFGWSANWTHNLKSTLTGHYAQAYDSIEKTPGFLFTDRLNADSEKGTGAIAVPLYKRVKVQSRLLTNLSLSWSPRWFKRHQISLSADINNLLNARTHSVNRTSSGIEVGRQLWLGLSYDFN